jgi:hypothetical protein
MASEKVPMDAKPGRSSQPANLDTWVGEGGGKPPPPPPPPTPPVKMKRLTLDIPEPLHKAIKMRSVQEGVAMVDMLRELLAKHYSGN